MLLRRQTLLIVSGKITVVNRLWFFSAFFLFGERFCFPVDCSGTDAI
jgi:hypothetical protein